MAAAPPSKDLFVYPAPAALETAPDLAARLGQAGERKGEGEDACYVLKLPDAAQRDEWRGSLLEAGILASAVPLATATRLLWDGFLRGTRSRVAPHGWAFLFGPFWYLSKRMFAKSFCIGTVFLVLQTINHLLSPSGLWPAITHFKLTLGGVGLPLELGIVELATVDVYALLFGRYDQFLLHAQGESLWPAFPGRIFRIPIFLVFCAALIPWALATFTVTTTLSAESSGDSAVTVTRESRLLDHLLAAAGAPAQEPQAPVDWEALEKDLFEALTLGDMPRAVKAVQAAGKSPPDPKTSQLKLAKNLHDMGAFFSNKAQFKQAAEAYSLAAATRSNHLGEEDPLAADSSHGAGTAYLRAGDLDQAAPLLSFALKVRKKILGPEHPKVAETANNLAVLYLEARAPEQAELLLRQVLEIRTKNLGPEDPSVGTTLNNLGSLYYNAGKLDEAGEQFRKALELSELHHGPDHPETATVLNNLGNVHFHQGKVLAAQKEYLEALRIREAKLPPNHPDLGMTYKSMAVVSAKQDRHKSAVRYYEKALSVFEAAYGPDHFQVARLLRGQAESLHKLGEDRSAAQLEERAKAIETKDGG